MNPTFTTRVSSIPGDQKGGPRRVDDEYGHKLTFAPMNPFITSRTFLDRTNREEKHHPASSAHLRRLESSTRFQMAERICPLHHFMDQLHASHGKQ